MTASAAQLQFAAEFLLFLVSAAAVGSVLLQGGLGRQRSAPQVALAVGFAALAVSALLRGSELAGDSQTIVVVGLRALGAAIAAIGCLWWSGGRAARVVLLVGLVLLGAAGASDLADRATATGILLAVGGACIGASVLLASRGSIAARVATSAAATLLVVVLVLGVALSAVLVDTIQDSAIDRLARRALNEATSVEDAATPRLENARVVGGALGGLPASRTALARLVDAPASGALDQELAGLSVVFESRVGLVYVARSGRPQGAVDVTSPTLVALTGSEVVRQALAEGAPRGSVDLVAGEAYAIGAQPVPVDRSQGPPLGLAVAVSPIDDTFLTRTARDDSDLSLALAVRTGVVASHGPQPSLAGIRPLVAAALEDGRRTTTTVGRRFVAVTPVHATDDRPVLALVASSPTSQVVDARDALFRNLFLIALGGTLLSLALASAVGDRIGRRLRRLTRAAQSIQEGNLSVRTGIDSGDEVGVLGTTFDAMATSVEEKTAAEVALRGRLEAVVGGMGEALVAVDREGRVTDFNRAAEELVGVPAGEARGRALDDVVSIVGATGNPLTAQLRATNGRWATEGWVRRRDGVRVPVAVSAGALRGPGVDGGGSVLVLRDLRPEREIEKMKTEFLSRVGHELRTPLTGVIGYADLLNRKNVPPERAREWRGEILAQSKGLLRIVEMLEFFASAGANRVLLRREPVDPAALVDEVVKRWRVRLGQPRAITRKVDRTIGWIAADRRLLASCLDEVVDNAVKFSPDGPRVVVSAEAVGARFVAITVHDRGIGMSADERERAFAPFVQADSSDTRAYGGLGLGLAFVQRVVEAHDGRLECESSQESGTKISIVLPIMPREEQ